MEELVNYLEGCRILGAISEVTLWRLIRDGELQVVKVRGRSMLRRSDLDAYIERSVRPRVGGEAA